MAETQGGGGELLTSVAALERGQAEPRVVAIEIAGGIACLAFVGGLEVTVPLGVGDVELFDVVAGIAGPLAPAVQTPPQFPEQPLSVAQKWVELLDDLGGWYPMLGQMRPGLRLASVRRSGTVARIAVTDGHRIAVTEVVLDDGLLVVGLFDDLVTSFGTLATPCPPVGS